MIKAIVFDYGGVLGKETMEEDVARSIARKLNLDYKFVLNNLEKLDPLFLTNNLSKQAFFTRFAELLDVSSNELERVWMNKFPHNPKLNKGLIPLVKRLKSRYKVAILSDSYKYRAEFLRKHGNYKMFPHVFLSCEIGLVKPDKRIFRYVVKRLKIRPNECVFIDDRIVNVEAAKEVGMKTILFKDAGQLEKDLKKYL